MSKRTDPEMFIDWLRHVTEYAYAKMKREQAKDPCCMWHEHEVLIAELYDFLQQCPPGSLRITPVDDARRGSHALYRKPDADWAQ